MIANVIRQTQANSNWCWAACASMTGRYITTNWKSQNQIVVHVKGSSINQGAYTSEMINALNFGCDYQQYWNFLNNDHFGFNNAVELLDSKKPFVIHFQKTPYSWHYVVGAGYDLTGSKVRIIDPWENTQTYFYAFNTLRTDATLLSGAKGWWNGTVGY